MSSVLEVPTALIMALILAASAGSEEGQLAPHRAEAQASPRIEAPLANPFAFNEQAWLAAFKRNGSLVGRADLAARIFVTSARHHYVPILEERARILALRDDIVLAGQLAVLAARENGIELARRLGRPVTASDLLAAHLLGLDDALSVLQLVTTSPNAILANTVGAKAFDLPELFFAGSRPRRAIEVATELKAALLPRAARGGVLTPRKGRIAAPTKTAASG